MPSKKATQRLRQKLEQQKKLKDGLRHADEQLYLLVYRTCRDEDVSTYGIARALGIPFRTVQGWREKGEKLENGE